MIDTMSSPGMSQLMCLAYMVKPMTTMLTPMASMLNRPCMLIQDIMSYSSHAISVMSTQNLTPFNAGTTDLKRNGVLNVNETKKNHY